MHCYNYIGSYGPVTLSECKGRVFARGWGAGDVNEREQTQKDPHCKTRRVTRGGHRWEANNTLCEQRSKNYKRFQFGMSVLHSPSH